MGVIPIYGTGRVSTFSFSGHSDIAAQVAQGSPKKSRVSAQIGKWKRRHAILSHPHIFMARAELANTSRMRLQPSPHKRPRDCPLPCNIKLSGRSGKRRNRSKVEKTPVSSCVIQNMPPTCSGFRGQGSGFWGFRVSFLVPIKSDGQ